MNKIRKSIREEVEGMRDYKVEAEISLEAVEDSLREAIKHLKDFEKSTQHFDIRLSGEARSYLVANLERFIENRDQPGSIASLYHGLDR